MIDIEDMVLEQLPMVTPEDLKSLPDISAVYFVVGHGDIMLYVGQSIQLRSRWCFGHHLRQDFEAHGFQRLYWYPVEDKDLAEVESLAIRRFKPLLNRSSARARMVPRKGAGAILATFYLDKETWWAFRVACMVRKTTASHMISAYIKEQLARWQAEAPHAAREERTS